MRNFAAGRRPLSFATAGLLLLVLAAGACSTSDPSSPNTPTELTGQTPNEGATFSGTISIGGSTTVPADDTTDGFLTAQVLDSQGRPVANGTLVNFSTSLGTVRPVGSDPATAGASTQVAAWGGEASVALRSATPGTAVITVWVANVVRTLTVTFSELPQQLSVSLAFRVGGTDFETVEDTAPTDLSVVATVTDEAGNAVAGRYVRIRIKSDTSATNGAGPASLIGPRRTRTNGAGEAFNVLHIEGEGRVVLIALLLDSAGDEIVGQSNQIVATTTAVSQPIVVSLEFTDGGTFATVTAGETAGLIATVTDAQTGLVLSGRRVRFRIVQDTATTTPATLANTDTTFTNGDGQAANAVTGNEAGSTVSIVAELLDANGGVAATSNQVVLAVQ